MKRSFIILSITSLLILGLLVVNQVSLLAKATTPTQELLTTASQLYQAGQFAQAALAYQQLVDQGYADSALYYNLGNAYYKQGHLGRAILNFRRAEELAPRDADIAANLELARLQAADKVEQTTESESLVKGLAGFTKGWLTLNELAIITLSLWVVLALLVIAYSNSRRGSSLREGLQYAAMVTAVVLALGLVGLGSRLIARHHFAEAVVVAGEINVTTSPSTSTEPAFVLHNGAEVEILEQRGSWARLALPQTGLEGWVPAKAIEEL